MGKHVYIKAEDSTFISLTLSDTTKYYISTKNGILTLSNDFEVVHQIDYSNVYLHYLNSKNYNCICLKKEF